MGFLREAVAFSLDDFFVGFPAFPADWAAVFDAGGVALRDAEAPAGFLVAADFGAAEFVDFFAALPPVDLVCAVDLVTDGDALRGDGGFAPLLPAVLLVAGDVFAATLRAGDLRAVDVFAPAPVFAELFLATFFAGDFLLTDFFIAVLAGAFAFADVLTIDFLLAAEFLVVALVEPTFLLAEDFFGVGFLMAFALVVFAAANFLFADFFTAGFFTADLRALVFLLTEVFFAAVFFTGVSFADFAATDFLLVAFFVVVFFFAMMVLFLLVFVVAMMTPWKGFAGTPNRSPC